jgi:NADPH:quinone reductase-like Zn-dependent oxidoreductase
MTAIGMVALLFTRATMAEAPSAAALPLMKAIVHHDYGSPGVLRLEEVDKPVPDDNQILVRVRAASVNPLDWHFLRGSPYIARLQMGLVRPKETRLGVDLAGQVEAVGKNVTQFKPGDEVFGTEFGAFAEYVCTDEKSLVLKPATITFEQAAAIPVAGATALQGLRDKGKIQAGQKVLINGAAGGVGTFAVQIAKSFGAEVTGVCSARNVEMVRSLGADRVIDYTKEDFTKGEQRYDLILDMIGNHSLSDCMRTLTPQGRLVIVGSTDKGNWLGPVSIMLRAAVLSRFASHDVGAFLAHTTQKDLTIVGDLMQAGKVRSVIDRRYGLSDVPEAIGYLEEGHARGKVVVTLEGNDVETSTDRSHFAASAMDGVGPLLIALAFVAILLGVPLAGALALHRRFPPRGPGQRPFRWGYYFSIQSLIGGIALGMMLESGILAVIACGAVYAGLAWFFAQRRHWAWVTLTILSFNPILWLINSIYLRRRWAEG